MRLSPWRSLTMILAAAFAATATSALADDYYVAIVRGDGVVLYDLSTARRTPAGFSIWSLQVRNPPFWNTEQGPVAYAMAREDYTCASQTYETPVFERFGADGRLRTASGMPDPTGRYRNEVLAGKPEARLTSAFCASQGGGAAAFGKAAAREVASLGTPVQAYRFADGLMRKEAR